MWCKANIIPKKIITVSRRYFYLGVFLKFQNMIICTVLSLSNSTHTISYKIEAFKKLMKHCN